MVDGTFESMHSFYYCLSMCMCLEPFGFAYKNKHHCRDIIVQTTFHNTSKRHRVVLVCNLSRTIYLQTTHPTFICIEKARLVS